MTMMERPRIAIIPGDPGGIGPELIARLLNTENVSQAADILLVGDRHVFAGGGQVAGLDFEMNPVNPLVDDWTRSERFPLDEMVTIDPADVRVAEVSEAGGRSSLLSLDRAMYLARKGIIDGFLFGPFNKAAMHLAGLNQSDELKYMAAKLEVANYTSELNVLDGFWTSRVTSHIPLREVADTISERRIHEAVHLIDRVLRQSGIKRPRISVAAVNPHAGDQGNFGTEEIEIIAPAVRQLQLAQMSVDGPWPSDTIFLKALAKEADAVVTMYHDQGQIALKLLGFDRGVSVLGGLPFPVVTPAHGTAFDIAGEGRANVGAMHAAFNLICEMARPATGGA